MRRVEVAWPSMWSVPLHWRRVVFGCIAVIDKPTSDSRMLLDCFDVRLPVPLLLREGEQSRLVGGLGVIEVMEVDAVRADPPHTHVVVESRKKLIGATGWIDSEMLGEKLWPAIDTDRTLVDSYEAVQSRDGKVVEPNVRHIVREWRLVGVTLHRENPGVWTEVTPVYVE